MSAAYSALACDLTVVSCESTVLKEAARFFAWSISAWRAAMSSGEFERSAQPFQNFASWLAMPLSPGSDSDELNLVELRGARLLVAHLHRLGAVLEVEEGVADAPVALDGHAGAEVPDAAAPTAGITGRVGRAQHGAPWRE